MTCKNGEALLPSMRVTWKDYSGWRYCELGFNSEKEYKDFLLKIRSQWTPRISMGIKPASFLPKAVFSDVDATLIPCESIEELAKVKGCLTEVRKITTLAMEGKFDFKQALKNRLSLLAGLGIEQVEEIANTLEPYPQVGSFIQWCHSKQITFHMVSGGFIQMLSILANKLNVEFVHTNNLEFRDQKMTGRLLDKIVDADEKRAWLLSRCEQMGLSPDQVLAIGDGANDLPMLKEAGLAVGFKPKSILYPFLSVLNNTESHEFHWKFLALHNK